MIFEIQVFEIAQLAMIQGLPGAYTHEIEKSISSLGRDSLEEMEEIDDFVHKVLSAIARFPKQRSTPKFLKTPTILLEALRNEFLTHWD